MELKLESSLAHQLSPVNAVATVVEASIRDKAQKAHQNPVLEARHNQKALEAMQREVGIYDKARKGRINERNLTGQLAKLPPQTGSRYLPLDIKMETGTGKTYVYTRTMFELHKRCGINKFIIAVPTLPIKAGTASFLGDAEVMRHFSDVCGYKATVELCLLEQQKQKKIIVVDVKDIPKTKEEKLYEQYEDLYKKNLITKEDLDAKRKELLDK